MGKCMSKKAKHNYFEEEHLAPIIISKLAPIPKPVDIVKPV